MGELNIGANPDDELAQLAEESGAVVVMSDIEQPQAPPEDPEPEQPQIPTAAMIQPMIMVASVMVCPNWELQKPHEALGGMSSVEYLSESMGACIDHYYPDVGENMPPWLLPILAVGTIGALHIDRPMKKPEEKKEKQQKNEEKKKADGVIGTPESIASMEHE